MTPLKRLRWLLADWLLEIGSAPGNPFVEVLHGRHKGIDIRSDAEIEGRSIEARGRGVVRIVGTAGA